MEGNLFIGRVAQRAIIAQDGKILVTRDVHNERYGLPGGRLDEGEEPEAGLKREIREELGVEINIERIVSTGIENYAGGPHYIVTFATTLSDPNKPITLDTHEVAEMKWITKEDFGSTKLYPSVENAIKTYFN